MIALLLILHIFCGSVALATGMCILWRKKGDLVHKKYGNLFVYSMAFSACLALILSFIRPQWLLTIIAIFTLYLIYSGKRCIRWSNIERPSEVDWLTGVCGALISFALTLIGLNTLVVNKHLLGAVILIFAGICFLLTWQQLIMLRYFSKTKSNYLPMHIQRMVGSYIAASTAFLVVNNQLLPGWIAWILPTLILVPWIVRWSREYAKKSG